MSLPFTGQLIIIIGAANCIGRATALRLATLGARLALYDNNEAVSDVCRACRDISNIDHIAVIMDILDWSACEHCFSPSLLYRGGAHICNGVAHVFNCWGINPVESTVLPTNILEIYGRLFTYNAIGLKNVALFTMGLVRPGGSFIGMACDIAPQPHLGMATYNVTQYAFDAVTGFTQSLAIELDQRGIRVNIVAPGFADDSDNPAVMAARSAGTDLRLTIPLMSNAEEVANAVVFVMGDRYRHLNRVIVEVNGPIWRVTHSTTTTPLSRNGVPIEAGTEEQPQAQSRRPPRRR